MKRIALITVPAVALMFGCAGEYSYGTPNGATTYTTGAEVYDDTPPANVETSPYYDYRGQPLYEVNGRYYGRRNNRWYHLNERPRDLDDRFRHERREHEEREHEHEHEHHD